MKCSTRVKCMANWDGAQNGELSIFKHEAAADQLTGLIRASADRSDPLNTNGGLK